jgi:hypothetical protein
MIESWMIGSSKYPQSKHVHTNVLKLAPGEDIEEEKVDIRETKKH